MLSAHWVSATVVWHTSVFWDSCSIIQLFFSNQYIIKDLVIFWANKCVLYPVQSASHLSFISQTLAKLHQISFIKSTMKYVWIVHLFDIIFLKYIFLQIWSRLKKFDSPFIFIWNQAFSVLVGLVTPVSTFEVHHISLC